MELKTGTARVYDALCAAESLRQNAVIYAFPYADKPTRLKETVLAVEQAELEAESSAIGAPRQYGRICVTVGVYAPLNAGEASLREAAGAAVSAVSSLMPCAIGVSATEADEGTQCLFCRCRFSFSFVTEETEDAYGRNADG